MTGASERIGEPQEKLKKKHGQLIMCAQVAFMNSTRDFIGAALKSLGLRYNTTPEDMARCGVSEDMLRERVAAFRSQVRLFSDEQHLAALYGGDVWVTVGSSTDVMRVRPLLLRLLQLPVACTP
jgi:spermidine/putrescine-binding protein